jgi:acetyl esterase/lipase
MRPYVEHFAKRARQAGVRMSLEVWPGMQHEWPFTAQSGIELGQLKVPTILGIFE